MENTASCDFADFDLTEYPVFSIGLKELDPSTEQVADFMDLYNELIEKRTGKYVVIVDGTDLKWISMSARIELGKRSKQIEMRFLDRYQKAYMVVPNILIKSILRGFNLVAKPVVPQVICGSFEEALNLAREEVAMF